MKASTSLSETVHVSTGGLAQVGWNGGGIVFPFVNLTKGDENNHFTVAAGYLGGTNDNGFNSEDINSPMLNFSGCVQVADHSWFMTENYYFFNPEFSGQFCGIHWPPSVAAQETTVAGVCVHDVCG